MATISNINLGPSTVIGASATETLGFYGATAIVQPVGAGQALITDSTGGTPATTAAAITAGGSYAQADIVAIKNALSSILRQTNAFQAALVNLGLIKGAA